MVIEDKINEKDVGLAKDYFELLKQICGYETHCHDDFVNTFNEKYLKEWESVRIIRSDLMDVCFKLFNVVPQDESWCKMKHICSTAMHCQENAVRLIKNGLYDAIRVLAEKHKECYISFLNLLGVTEDNISNESSA